MKPKEKRRRGITQVNSGVVDMKPRLITVCVLASMVFRVWTAEADIHLSLETHMFEVDESQIERINPWREDGTTQVNVTENFQTIPRHLAMVQSDHFPAGAGLFRLRGPGVDQEPKDMFRIDERTGVIWIKQLLDREVHQSFEVTVSMVSDRGDYLETPIQIKIRVIDMNDNTPVFTQEVYTGSVQELSAPGTSVMQVSATDADEPKTLNSELHYFIIGQETVPANVLNKTMFAINQISGNITTSGDGLDWEVVKAFRLRLKVADYQGLGLSSEGVVIINVTDTNNHAPGFSLTSYHMTAVQNSIGDIGRVSVMDGDEPGTGNWEAKYSISDDPNGYFSIRTDAETNQGILSVVKPLNNETVKELRLALSVENINPLSSKAPEVPVSTATVIITVIDENQPPYFTQDPIILVVPQNVLPGTSLKTNIAVYPYHLGFSFQITDDPENWLDINEETGEIMAGRGFNRSSALVKYQVHTAAVKLSGPRGTSVTATVQIIVVASNFGPQLSPLSGSICKNAGNFSSGLVLRAVYEDPPPQAGPFSFDIPENSWREWNMTQVNDTHAVLQPGADLQLGVYQVTIMVSDSGTPILHSSAPVSVTLCECDSTGDCRSATSLESGMGTGLIAIIIVVALSVPILLGSLLTWVVRRGRNQVHKGNDNQAGDGDDKNAVHLVTLSSASNAAPGPDNTAPAPRNASPVPTNQLACPHQTEPIRANDASKLSGAAQLCGPPVDLMDIKDLIFQHLEAVEKDPNMPPCDTVTVYNYEEDSSVAESLSSIFSSSSDDQDYDYLNNWGPRFQVLAAVYSLSDENEPNRPESICSFPCHHK